MHYKIDYKLTKTPLIMKTQKLNLNNLKVESFVTSLEDRNSQTIKGGSGSTLLCYSALVVVVSAFGAGFAASVAATVAKHDAKVNKTEESTKVDN